MRLTPERIDQIVQAMHKVRSLEETRYPDPVPGVEWIRFFNTKTYSFSERSRQMVILSLQYPKTVWIHTRTLSDHDLVRTALAMLPFWQEQLVWRRGNDCINVEV